MHRKSPLKSARAASWSVRNNTELNSSHKNKSSQKAKTTAVASNKQPKMPMSTTTHRKPSYSNATTPIVLVVLALVGLIALSPVAAYTDGALFRQQFETTTATAYLCSGKATVTKGILKASYIPNDRGSPRLTKNSNLNSTVTSATVSYDLKLNKNANGTDFEFVNGDKLHGLGGGNATTGCVIRTETNGWSVRLMWRANGVPNLYV
jgi:hypothetical protein